MEIRAEAEIKQTSCNPWSEGNGGCSHLCLFHAVSYAPVPISPTTNLARPVSGFWRGLNEFVIDTILLTDAVNITLPDYMEHGVHVNDVLSTDDKKTEMRT